MALEAKLGQELRLRQQLVMTPQLQQAIKILQLALPELEAVIQGELEQNPMIEPLDRSPAEGAAGEGAAGESAPAGAGDGAADGEAAASVEAEAVGQEAAAQPPPAESRDATRELKELGTLDRLDWREYLENYSNNWQDGAGSSGGEPEEEQRLAMENTLSRKTSLEDHLIWQLRMSDASAQEQRIGAAIIYNLSDDGYLETPLEELAAQLEVPVEEVARVLKRVQRCDPPGVAARDLGECLSLQLANLGMEESLATKIVAHYLPLLERHRHGDIAKALGVSQELVAQAAKVISLLEPKPGRDYGGPEPAYITPDVFIHKLGDEYVVTLNEGAVPRLRLSGYYQRVLRDGEASVETRNYLQEKLRSARWLVKSIYQRQQTIFKVASSIVKFQRAFLDHGLSTLRPLVLKDVADDIGMHESTISRATANKYAHTPQGIFELKFFFTSSVKGAAGEDVSAETVKAKIRALVAGEDRREPLSDQAIAENLRGQQINIARRTVAKYRQALAILPSARRKQVS